MVLRHHPFSSSTIGKKARKKLDENLQEMINNVMNKNDRFQFINALNTKTYHSCESFMQHARTTFSELKLRPQLNMRHARTTFTELKLRP
ncbi:unnamed protein product [Cercopithifilaria johnstoni]|uniref:Uncharacterized protein n=1 Tax=Cercopithifilaria johnstoni TaxID=2874296 RepID=A0A8J2PRH5_9BILA|nr:unnamed protein product [Cercopithifilaria johnstoni]